MNITPATPADLPALARLEREVFAHGAYPGFLFRQAMDLWPLWLLVARDDAGQPGAYVFGAPAEQAERAWLLSAATHPSLRGRGVGRALLRRLLELLACSGVREVRLTVHPDNPAQHLYAREGFVVESSSADYFGPGEPRLVMRCDLHAARLHVLDTERLALRRFALADAPFIVALLNTPGWRQYIGDRGVRDEAGARAYLHRAALASYARHGFGLWHVSRRDTGEAVGMCGLLQRPDLPDADVGFAFLPQHTGLGFAGEAVEGTLAYARDTLGLDRVAAVAQDDNARSIGLLQKKGFRSAGRYPLPDGGELALLRLDLRKAVGAVFPPSGRGN